MLWVTLRQHRPQIVVTTIFVAALGIVLLVHGLAAHHVIDQAKATGCQSPRAACVGLEEELTRRFRQIEPLLAYLVLVPAVVGAFWGAPLLAREYERHTSLIIWTQSVPRRRWIRHKLVALGAIVTVLGLSEGIMVVAWFDVFHGLPQEGIPPDPSLLAIRGVTPGTWWLAAFTLGTMWGAALRKTLPAMMTTIGTVFGLMFVVNLAQDTPGRTYLLGGFIGPGQAAESAILILVTAVAGLLTVRLVQKPR